MSDERLSMFTIYRNPSDYPGKYVVREQRIGPGVVEHAKDPMFICDTLRAARTCLQVMHPGLACLGRNVEDDPVIVEVWV